MRVVCLCSPHSRERFVRVIGINDVTDAKTSQPKSTRKNDET